MVDGAGEPLYMRVASAAREWSASTPGVAGLVVGATDIDAMCRLRAACPDTPFLIPGIGAQGGDAAAVMKAAAGGPLLVNSSRSIIYASDGDDFEAAAGHAARDLRDVLNKAARG